MEQLSWFFQAYSLLVGLVIGSFLNVVIYRVPLKLSVAKGHSFCPTCSHRLHAVDLVPVFSFVFLRGKCRYCGAPIGMRYPLVELANALCYWLVYVQYGFQWVTLLYFVCCSCLICVALIDGDHQIIPDRFNIIIGVCGLIMAVFARDISWVARVIGLFCVSMPVLLIVLFTGGMGEGDVKLFAALGLLLGWKLSLFTVLVASVTAAVYGVAVMIRKKGDGKLAIPFGPFISAAGILAILCGNALVDAYVSLLIGK